MINSNTRSFLPEWASKLLKENPTVWEHHTGKETLHSLVLTVGELKPAAYKMLETCPAPVLGRMIEEIPPNESAGDDTFSAAHSMVRCTHGFRDIETLTASGRKLMIQLAATAVIAEAVSIMHTGGRVPQRSMLRVVG